MAQVVNENSEFVSEDSIHIYTILWSLSICTQNICYCFELIVKNIKQTSKQTNIDFEVPKSFHINFENESKVLEVEQPKHP